MHNRIFNFFLLAFLLAAAGTAQAACTAPAANVGAREYFTGTGTYKYCDGTNWIDFQTTALTGQDGLTISAGTNSTCAIRTDGTAMCWGDNAVGQLGNGATGNSTTPSALAGGSTWKAMTPPSSTFLYDISTWTWAVNIARGCGIKSGGALWCWGNGVDNYGCSGTWPASPVSSTPALFDSGSWTHIAGRRSTTIEVLSASCPAHPPNFLATNFCGIKSDGTAWCWGDNTHGQLGNGTTTASNTPVQISGGAKWKTIAIGAGDLNITSACAIKSDDTLWCWGHNGNGQLGNGNTTSQTSPVAVGGSWKIVSLGGWAGSMACGIKTDDTAWCWGSAQWGQLGNGASSGNQTTPSAVSGGGTWKDISAGAQHVCGIKSDDTAWCWGNGASGRRGDGATTTTQTTPVAVSGGATWKTISAGQNHTCGVKTDGSLWCWGAGASGQRGDGSTTTTQTTPVAVSGGYTWKTGCTAGTYDYNSSNKYKFCIGGSWVEINCSAGGCGSLGASTAAGAIDYFPGQGKYAYSNGTSWQVIAP